MQRLQVELIGGLVTTNFIVGRCTASAIASASRKSFFSLSGGLQFGYNRVLPSHFLLGIEGDVSFLNALSAKRSGVVPHHARHRSRREDRIHVDPTWPHGYYLNLEQSVTDEVGLFARWSWNDGKTEIAAFTDIDSSFSFGTSIKGTA
jgi:hypothetical protein